MSSPLAREALSTDQPAEAAGNYLDLVRHAILAASSHNTQPWKFRLERGAISILPDLSRCCPAVDPDDHPLYASLGCAAATGVRVNLEEAGRGNEVLDPLQRPRGSRHRRRSVRPGDGQPRRATLAWSTLHAPGLLSQQPEQKGFPLHPQLRCRGSGVLRSGRHTALDRGRPLLRAPGTAVARSAADSGIPGVAIAVLQDGRAPHVRGFGHDGRGKASTGDTPFRIGSLTKSFTALRCTSRSTRGASIRMPPCSITCRGFASRIGKRRHA